MEIISYHIPGEMEIKNRHNYYYFLMFHYSFNLELENRYLKFCKNMKCHVLYFTL